MLIVEGMYDLLNASVLWPGTESLSPFLNPRVVVFCLGLGTMSRIRTCLFGAHERVLATRRAKD